MPTPTQLLCELSAGDQRAADALLPIVYDQLHSLAEHYMKRERADHILQPTALVHEAYMKLVDQTQIDWKGRTHFMGVAARAMQRVLIDQARARDRQKRGGMGPGAASGASEKNPVQWRRVALDDAFSLSGKNALDVLELEDVLNRMHQIDPRQARIATLKIFGEMQDDQVADLLDVSTRTVERDWKMAKAWLRRELCGGTTNS